MRLGMSHYGHKSIPDAKFESSSSSSFGDMTSQNFPQKKGTSHQIQLFTPGKWVLLKKEMSFMSIIYLLDPKLIPHVNFSNFQGEEIFSFCKILECPNEKRAAATLPD